MKVTQTWNLLWMVTIGFPTGFTGKLLPIPYPHLLKNGGVMFCCERSKFYTLDPIDITFSTVTVNKLIYPCPSPSGHERVWGCGGLLKSDVTPWPYVGLEFPKNPLIWARFKTINGSLTQPLRIMLISGACNLIDPQPPLEALKESAPSHTLS